MVDSGIKCHDECSAAFHDLEKCKFEYIIMKIDKVGGKDLVVISKKAEKGSCEAAVGGKEKDGVPAIWSEFTKALSEEDIAFGCGYISYPTKDGRIQEKLIFVFWCTGTAKITSKMIYASSKLSTSKKIKSISYQLQADDKDDVAYKEVLKQISKGEAKI